MKYKKPICNCGKELIYSTLIVYQTQKTINKNGTLSKKKSLVSANELGVYSPLGDGDEHLECPHCYERFVCDYDKNGRVIRGRKI